MIDKLLGQIMSKINGAKNEKDPEQKKENELTLNDRLILLARENEKFNSKQSLEIFKFFMDNKKYSDIIDINDRVYLDLEFFDDFNQNNNNIYNKINNTYTTLGGLTLQSILKNPINNIDTLKKRQNLIQSFEKFTVSKQNHIINDLKVVNELETEILWFWNKNNNKHLTIFKDMVFLNLTGYKKIDNYINNNPIILSVHNWFKIFLTPLFAILSPFTAIVIPLILFFIVRKKLPFKISTKGFFKFIAGSLFGGGMTRFMKQGFKAKILGFFSSAMWFIFYIQGIFSNYKVSKNLNKIINLIHNKLNCVKKFITNAREILTNTDQLDLTIVYPDFNKNKIIENLSFLETYFKHDVFNKEPYLFSNKGMILSTYNKFLNVKDYLIELFHFTGSIDTIQSLFKLKNQYGGKHIYSYAKYNNREQPSINVEGLWHPCLDEKPILNDVNMNQNIIITGPNAAGKSTFIKSMIVNCILAQTIGIVSSKKFELVPFEIIETYLHIPDNKGVSSLFEAEMLRSKDYINTIKDNNKKSIIIMDELFSSTNYIEGFSGAFAVLQKLASFNNSLFLTTTHYSHLGDLEKKDSNIVNYKFDIERDPSNNIVFNYKLKKGVSNQYIALELLRENEFDDDLIENAIKVSKNIKIMKKELKKSEKKKTKEDEKKSE